jgi:tetratricopeptide (TPR) repeat protein
MRRRTRARITKAVVLGLALGLVVALYRWYYTPLRGLPSPDLAGADGEVASAIRLAAADVRQWPRSGSAWGKLGMVLAAHDFYPEANACFATAERFAGPEARWPYLHGVTLLFSDSDAALERLQRAADFQANDPVIRLRLADELLARERLDEAEKHYGRILQLEPDHPRALLGLGRLACRRGQLDQGREQLTRAAASPYAQKAALAQLAELEQRGGNAEAAAKAQRRAAELPDDPPWPDSYVTEVEQLRVGNQARLASADQLLHKNRVADALSLLQQATRDQPEAAWAWLNLGRMLNRQRDFLGAERALRAAVRLEPGSVEAQFQLGVALFQQGKPEDAVAHFREAARLKPDHALAHYNLGHCLKRGDVTAGAVEAFRAAVRCRPGFAEAHANLGELLHKAGETQQALDHLRLAVSLNPADADARGLLERLQQEK